MPVVAIDLSALWQNRCICASRFSATIWRFLINKPMRFLKKIATLLTLRQRRQSAALLGLMLVGSVLETAGVGLIVPVLALMASADPMTRIPQLKPLLDVLGQPTQSQLILMGMSALFVVYLLKSLFLALLYWKLNAFVFAVRADLSQRLFAGYLRQPWSFHLQRNSAHLISMLASETNQFTASALQPALLLATELLVLTGICALVIIAEPRGAFLLITMLGITAVCFQRLTRDRLAGWGKARLYHEGLRVLHAQQGIGGAKDVKLLGREDEFLAQYAVHNLGSARAVERQQTLQQMPRLLLEVLAVGGLTLLAFVILEQGKSPTTVLATLGLFAAAAFRIMPSINRAVGAMQSLRYSRPTVDALSREFHQLEKRLVLDTGTPFEFRNAIVLTAVQYQYPTTHKTTLSDINITIPRGGSVGFIGGSGAGKSTLVDIILGLLSPTSGTVTVDGVDIQHNLRGWQDKIGYVPQSIFLTDDSLRRNVAFGVPEEQIDDDAVQRAIHAAQLEEFSNSLPEGLNTSVGERGVRLSGGQRQRIGIARALYHDPQVMVLDEATSALDTDTEGEVMAAVNALSGEKTLIIVAHRLSTVAHCERLYKLEHGQIVEDGAFETMARGIAV